MLSGSIGQCLEPLPGDIDIESEGIDKVGRKGMTGDAVNGMEVGSIREGGGVDKLWDLSR